MVKIVFVLAYLILAPFLGGLLDGVDRIISARMQRRKGPGLLQPFYDLGKLFSKEMIAVNNVQLLLNLSYLVILMIAGCMLFYGADLLMVLFILSTADMFLIMAASSDSSPYANMGASREMLQMMAYEPLTLLIAVGFYLTTGSFQVSDIIRADTSAVLWMPGLLVGFMFTAAIKFRKSPFDLSTSHHAHHRNIAVVQRKKDFTVAIGYETGDGTWAQGVYDFKDEKSANEYREKYYGKDVEPPEKWYEVFVSKDALIRTYEKSSLMRMPASNREYADYTYYIYNNRIKESRQLVDMQSDSREVCYKLLLSEGEMVHLRNRDGDEAELTAQEFSELVNHTSDKDYVREGKPRIEVNIPQEAMIKDYEKSSLFRAPNGSEYEGYIYYLPNSVLHESEENDSAAVARLAEDFIVTLRKDDEEVKITAQEFSELIGQTTAEEYKREPALMDEYRQQLGGDEWHEIPMNENAVIANYEKSTLFKMPRGEYEGYVYYIPSGMVRKSDDGLKLRLPETFEVHLKMSGEDDTLDLTAEQLAATLDGKTDEDYESIYRKPSEEARKQFEKVEKQLRESLPDEMCNKPNWVVVRTRKNEEKNKLDKFLIDAHTGKFAESDNPETWTDFDSACEYAKTHGGVALAYALDGTDGIACIDLDRCIGEDGKRSALADEVLSKCGKTYIESSVSGKGLHIFGTTKGEDLRSFSKDGDMEYYQGGQFIAMTGDGAGYSRLASFDTPEMKSLLSRKLERRQEWKNTGKGVAGLSQMEDHELLEKAFSAKNGDTVKRLYNGEDLRHNHSNSDMSLMNYLAFYSGGNIEQMTRIFATSGLYRPEKPASYYEYTAIKAAKDTPHYTPPKASTSAPKSANSGNSKA